MVEVTHWRRRRTTPGHTVEILETVQVTPDNLDAVARWCGGHVTTTDTGAAVAIRIGTSIIPARIGDHVVRITWPDATRTHYPMRARLLRDCYDKVD